MMKKLSKLVTKSKQAKTRVEQLIEEAAEKNG
jgi:hypothetical protein